MLQVKYRKGTMMKFDVAGQTVLLYEVAYITVPTLTQEAKVTDEEIQKIDQN
jgi:hypothetical protein